MTAIEKIEERLRQYASLRYAVRGNMITVEAPTRDGFSIWLQQGSSGCTVGFDGWHEEFADESEALAVFWFGLSGDCRLKVVQRGAADCAWTVESHESGEWREYSSTGLFFVPFWRRRRVVYRQNGLIENKSL